MKNAKQLRDDLSDVFDKLRAGEIDRNSAAELANIAGKMISSAKVQVEYFALRKEAPKIDFLEGANSK